ncbi:MAG TPA: hypothetical protein VIM48_01460 [Chthoniobacterales bacterium]
MLSTEYQQRVAAKKAAAQAFHERKQAIRQRIADAVLSDPARAIRSARSALSHKNAAWQQWSKTAWLEILRAKRPEEIAEMLVHPGKDEEALVDSHPFAGLRASGHAH